MDKIPLSSRSPFCEPSLHDLLEDEGTDIQCKHHDRGSDLELRRGGRGRASGSRTIASLVNGSDCSSFLAQKPML